MFEMKLPWSKAVVAKCNIIEDEIRKTEVKLKFIACKINRSVLRCFNYIKRMN